MSRFVLTAQLQLQAPNNVTQVVRQIQSQLNGVNVQLNVQGSARAQRQLQQVTTQTQAATTAADRMGRAFAISIRRFAAFSIATRAVSLFTSTLSKAVETAIDFERELIKISQVTGKTMAQLKGLTREITSLSTSLGVGSQSLLSVTRILSQAGFKANDLSVALGTLARTELAPTFDDITQTAEGAIAIFNQFKQGAAALESQLGAVNAVAGQFAVEAGDLIDVVRRAGGVFKSAGGELNELIALFTSVRATTRESAESIGTGLRTIFTRIQRPKTIEFLKQFGVELVDLEGKFVGPFEAVRRLSTALAGLGEGDITFIKIAEELGGFRQIGKVLPLIQQFAVAQEALNVANKAGNSLAEDAAKAQASLAVRIMKVKEEFLALIRGITETQTFQIMANTALNLASALIKIADAIKPLLPLLAAVAAIKFARGISGFAASFMGGMRSGRTYSTGGEVHHFARGGMVPGTGNRDTVPAMLQPGEFVIKKTSVNKLGASNLAAMNKYAAGGIVHAGRNLYGSLPPMGMTNKTRTFTLESAIASGQFSRSQLSKGFGVEAVNARLGTSQQAQAAREKQKTKKRRGLSGEITINPSSIGGFFLRPNKGAERDYKINRTVKLDDGKYSLKGKIDGFYTGKNDLAGSSIGKIVREETSNSLRNSIKNVATTVQSKKLVDVPPIDGNEKIFEKSVSNLFKEGGAQATIEGYMLEGLVSALSGATLAGGKSTFDYPSSSLNPTAKGRLASIFRSGAEISSLVKADAKRTGSPANYKGIGDKLVSDIRKKNFEGLTVKKFAAGGGVGTDTVPALLTPGEFVVNRSSAQRIGYGNLNRMNKVGKYAKGGVVQRFAEGGGVTSKSVRSAVSGLADNQSIQREIAVTSQEIKKTGNYAKKLSGSMDKQAKVTDVLYKESATLDARIKKYDQALMQIAKQQGKAQATGKAANRIVQMKIDAETKLIEVDKKALASEKTLEGIKKKHSATVERQTALMDRQNALIQQARSNKTAATQLVQQDLTTGTQSNYRNFDRQADRQAARVRQADRQAARQAAYADARENNRTGAHRRGRFFRNRSNAGGMDANAAIAISMISASLQAMLPPLDENASALTKMSHGLLSLVTGLAGAVFALETFGLSLNAQNIMGFLGGGGMGKRAMASMRGGLMDIGLSKPLATNLTSVANGLTKFLGPVAAGAATFLALQTAGNFLVESFMEYDKKIKKAIESGNVESARNLAEEQQLAKTAVNIGSGAAGGAVTGALLGSFLGPLGTAIGAAAGAIIGATVGAMLSDSVAYAGQVAATQAALTKSQKELTQASKKASEALNDFQKGNISATEFLQSTASATLAVNQSMEESRKLTELGNKEIMAESDYGGLRGGLRNVFTLGGLLGESTGEKTARIEAENEKSRKEVDKQEKEILQTVQPAMNAMAKQVAMTGGSFEDLMAKIKQTDPNLYAILMRQGAQELNKSFQNIAKEVARTKAALEATNLGLRGAQATSVAMSASMDRFVAGLEVGGNTFVANTEFLSQAMTSAAQAMNPDDIKSAINDVSKNLSNMGISKTLTDKFENNTNAFVQAQQNYGKAFDNIVAESKAMGKVFSADELKTKFADQLVNMMGPDVSDDAKKNMKAIIENIDLNPDEVNEIMSGNYKAFGDKLSEAGQKQFEEIMKIAQERQKAEQAVIKLIQQRADAEKNLAQAQKEAVDLYMEGRQLQAKYGGQAVTTEERRAAIVRKANTGISGTGLNRLQTGSVAELRRRNAQIFAGFAGIEGSRRKIGGAAGVEGVRDDIKQKKLQDAQKDQIKTIRDLIKLEEEELKLIQEKNKLEKDSLQSLIDGDIEKFFDQQAAMGAQAAIAGGNVEGAQMFGAKALAEAFKDLQRQQEAGVQSLFGRNLGGPGGLLEGAAAAALGARGITDPRMAQRLAGSTAQEESAKATIRELGQVLGETGEIGAAMAEMKVDTANIQVQKAELILSDIDERGKKAAENLAANMNRGGVVYANRGVFVPRGTDTVPAMLTPGEFVVRREAVNRGNNLQLLNAMNNGSKTSGFAKGGKVGYYNNGGKVQYLQNGGNVQNANMGISPETITNLGNVFTKFITNFNESIKNLQNTRIKLDFSSVNVNLNLNGMSRLSEVSDQAKSEIMRQVIQQLKDDYGINDNGKLTENTSNLPRPGQGI